MIDRVVKKLDAMGYIKNSADDWAIKYAYDRSYNFIKAETNLKKIPRELETVFIDLIAAEFLDYKRINDGEKEIKQIQEGDINIVYADNNLSDINKFISTTRDRAKKELLSYRRLRW